MRAVDRWYDYITVNIYYLGLTTLSQTNGIVIPLLVQRFVGEAGKASFFGTLRLWTLMVALLVQSASGMLSDHSPLRWGRRRPFILVGTLLDVVFIALIGFTIGMEGTQGYWFLFVMSILLSLSSNIAHGAEQGLIPDLVPEEKRGRFSGIKAVLEIPLPLILVSFTIARLVSGGNLLAGLLIAMGVLVIAMLVTMLVPEKPLGGPVPALDWAPFIRLALMTISFTAVILIMGGFFRLIGGAFQSFDNVMLLAITMGGLGLLAMAIAVALGVWASVQISLGEAAQRNPAFTWWVVNRLAFLVGTTNLSTFAIYFLQARLGYVQEKAAQPASILMLIVGVFILLSALPAGWLADRYGHKRLVALSGLIAALGTIIALSMPNLVIIYVGGSLIGLATGTFFTSNWALGTQLVPKAEAGRYLGISNLAGAGAGAVGAYIGGPIADFFTANVPQIQGLGYIVLFSIYGLLFLLSVLALSQVRSSVANSRLEPAA